MEHRLMNSKGSFSVNASSGFVLYDLEQPKDSKVLIAPQSYSSVTNDADRMSRHFTLAANDREQKKELKRIFHRRSKEDAAFDKAVSQSLESNKKRDEDNRKDSEVLERAISLSLLNEEKQKEKKKEEEEKLQEVIELSKRESILQSIDEEDQIRKAKEISKIEYDDPDADIKQLIELSMMPEETGLNQFDDQEGDKEILKALELSLIEF
ncbi:unnamed protein product [Pseudo-nitzschia multistriata]|uniref:Uncharacterized protein n=1 Tax=Pseudo-nitzschia multistriata TaxID=183589 RepID=A0A448ZL54_9STRA|nr:unnamed protein product [Pseudo-nitzschia multistriata]